jgi:hypothetical protein
LYHFPLIAEVDRYLNHHTLSVNESRGGKLQRRQTCAGSIPWWRCPDSTKPTRSLTATPPDLGTPRRHGRNTGRQVAVSVVTSTTDWGSQFRILSSRPGQTGCNDRGTLSIVTLAKLSLEGFSTSDLRNHQCSVKSTATGRRVDPLNNASPARRDGGIVCQAVLRSSLDLAAAGSRPYPR